MLKKTNQKKISKQIKNYYTDKQKEAIKIKQNNNNKNNYSEK